MKRTFGARSMLIASMAIFGTIGVFVKNISLSAGELALYRAVMASALIFVYLLITKNKIEFKALKKEVVLLFLSGAAMGFNWILLFEAYKYTTVSIATLAYYFAPVIVMIASPIIFKERMRAYQWVCFAVSTAGIALITGIGDTANASSHFWGIALGLGAACRWGAVVRLNKHIKETGNIQRTFLQFVAAAVVLIPYVAFTDGVNLGSLDAKGWICLAVVGILHTGITYCMYFASVRSITGQQAAILSYIDPLVAVLLSVLVLGESMAWIQVIGGALILGSTLCNELIGFSSKKGKNTDT